MHTFINCSHSQGCWKEVDLIHIVNNYASNTNNFVDWFFQVLAHVGVLEIGKIAMILWQI